jgi:hypothetical protein
MASSKISFGHKHVMWRYVVVICRCGKVKERKIYLYTLKIEPSAFTFVDVIIQRNKDTTITSKIG